MYREKCFLCPRGCGADRSKEKGFCGCGDTLRISKYMIYKGEEPCISGENGSGAIFFSGCNLRCVFCQNHVISHGCKGRDISEEELLEICLYLKEQGANNIELITATHFSDKIAGFLEKYKEKTALPIVFNCGGYEKPETLKMLDGLIDVYLPDLKYYSSEMSAKYSGAADYFERAIDALREMRRQQPAEIYDKNGIMKKGVLIRHLVLPKGYKDSIRLLEVIKEEFEGNIPPVSLMRQYTPCFMSKDFPEINRRLTTFEYDKVINHCSQLGIEGFMQEKGCENLELTPDF